MKFIPVNRPLITKMEADSVAKCIKSGWISGDGPYVKKFEKEFAKTVSRKYAITVSNGTAALDIAIKSINIKKGEEVIVPAFTIISCWIAWSVIGGFFGGIRVTQEEEIQGLDVGEHGMEAYPDFASS